MKRTVAFLTPDLSIGGVEKVFLDYANALSLENYKVSFILVHKRGTLLSELYSEVSILELQGERLRYVFFSLVKLLKIKKFDYVVAGTEKTNVLIYLANIMAGKPSKVVTSQHNFMDIESSSFIHKHILPYVLKHSYFTFAVSNGIKQMLLDMGISDRKIDVLYNPINIKKIREQADEKITMKLPLKYILFIGRFYPVKNIPLLLKSFQVFSNNISDYKLVMVGDGQQKQMLMDLANDLGVANSIIWVGATNNPYPYIKNASIVALTSFSESLSNVVLESICLGKTVVTTPCKGPIEVLKNGKYGYITDSHTDVKSFVDVLVKASKEKKDSEVLMHYANGYDLAVSLSKLKCILS